MIFIDITLKSLLKVFETLLGNTLKDSLKKKSSSQKAKTLAFDLYNKLRVLNEKTDSFVNQLELFEKSISERFSSEEHGKICRDLDKIGKDLMKEVKDLSNILDKMDPQLEIHRSELVDLLKRFKTKRILIIKEVTFMIDDSIFMQPDDAHRILSEAENNRMLIQNAVVELRTFLSTEFTFKESF